MIVTIVVGIVAFIGGGFTGAAIASQYAAQEIEAATEKIPK